LNKPECRIATTSQLTSILIGDRPDWIDALDPHGKHALVPLRGIKDVRLQVRGMLKPTGSSDPILRYFYVDWSGYYALPVAGGGA
jgi:hypothetical protein